MQCFVALLGPTPDCARWVLMDEAFDEPWMIAMLATPHSSYEISGHSLMHYSSAMTHFGVRKSEQLSVRLDSESQVKSGLELLEFQLMLRVLLAQLYPLSFMRALSMSFEPDRQSQAVTRSQCFSVHSARASNLEIVHTSLRRSIVKFDEGVERHALDIDYVHAEAAYLPIIQVPLRDIHETSIQSAPKRDFGHLTRIIKWKSVPAVSSESSTMTCVLRRR